MDLASGLLLRKTSSTPEVVPGAALALAKAGVGGYRIYIEYIYRIYIYIEYICIYIYIIFLRRFSNDAVNLWKIPF